MLPRLGYIYTILEQLEKQRQDLVELYQSR